MNSVSRDNNNQHMANGWSLSYDFSYKWHVMKTKRPTTVGGPAWPVSLLLIMLITQVMV